MNFFQMIYSPNRNIAYCDGACKGNQNANAKGGYGAVIVTHDKKLIKLYGGANDTTNNQMELKAAIMVLELTAKDIPLVIKCDSKYVVTGITEWIFGWKKKNWQKVKNVELWKRLYDLTIDRQIEWRWVKGHNGELGNEVADNLANAGVYNQSLSVTVMELDV